MIISFDNITKRHDVPSKGSTEPKTIARSISLLGIKGREEHKKGYHGDAIMNMLWRALHTLSSLTIKNS